MKTAKQRVEQLCSEVYDFNFTQIVIDFIQDEVEELLLSEESITRDNVGALAYKCDNILIVINPAFAIDAEYLPRLLKALNDWHDDIESVNQILGLPKES